MNPDRLGFGKELSGGASSGDQWNGLGRPAGAEMGQDALDDLRILDASNHAGGAAAAFTDAHVDIKHTP